MDRTNSSTTQAWECQEALILLKAQIKANDVKATHHATELNEVRSLVPQLENVLKSKSAEIQKLEIEKQKLEAAGVFTKGMIEAKDERLKYYEENVNALIKSNESLVKEVETLRAAKEKAESTNSSLQGVIISNDGKIAKQDFIIAQLKSEVELKSAENQKLDFLKGQLEQSQAFQQGMAEAKDAKIEEQENMMNSLLEKIETLTKSIETLRKATESEQIAQLNAKISALQSDIKGKDVKIVEQGKQLNSLLKNIEYLTKSVDAVKEMKENGHITETTIRAKFSGISTLTDAHVFSRPITVAGIVWCLKVYRLKDDLAVFLRAFKPNAAEWSCSVLFELQLISQKIEHVVYSRERRIKADNVCSQNNNCGYADFISIKDLFDEERGYVKDDSIIIAASIKVFPAQ